MKNILFYGDSNTWGYDPETHERYPYENRWTTICAKELGEEYYCIPAGMNGRSTSFDDPLKACRNGLDGLDYSLQTNKPLDLLVLMIGTNDLKYTDAAGSADGMERLVEKIMTANERYNLSSPVFPNGAQLLLISPVLVMQDISEREGHDAREESRKLSGLYADIAKRHDIAFMNLADIAAPSDVDGVHLGLHAQEKIGRTIAQKIKEIF